MDDAEDDNDEREDVEEVEEDVAATAPAPTGMSEGARRPMEKRETQEKEKD